MKKLGKSLQRAKRLWGNEQMTVLKVGCINVLSRLYKFMLFIAGRKD